MGKKKTSPRKPIVVSQGFHDFVKNYDHVSSNSFAGKNGKSCGAGKKRQRREESSIDKHDGELLDGDEHALEKKLFRLSDRPHLPNDMVAKTVQERSSIIIKSTAQNVNGNGKAGDAIRDAEPVQGNQKNNITKKVDHKKSEKKKTTKTMTKNDDDKSKNKEKQKEPRKPKTAPTRIASSPRKRKMVPSSSLALTQRSIQEDSIDVLEGLAKMHRETLDDEIARLVNENARFARTITVLTSYGNSKTKHLKHMELEMLREAELERHTVKREEEVHEKVHEMETTVNTKLTQVSKEHFRHKQLKHMYMRTMKEHNLSRKRSEMMQTLRDDITERSGLDLQKKYREVLQENESLQNEMNELQQNLNIERSRNESILHDRRKMLNEIHQLRMMQLETKIRRKEIVLKTKGELMRRDKNTLRKASYMSMKRRSQAATVLANISCQVARYETALKRMQAATGIKDMSTVIDRFFSQETKRVRLEKETLEATKKIEELKMKLAEANDRLVHIREYGVQANQGAVHDFGSLEQKLLEAKAKMRYKQESIKERHRMIVALSNAMISLARQLFVPIHPLIYNSFEISRLGEMKYVQDYTRCIKYVQDEVMDRLVIVINATPDGTEQPTMEPGSPCSPTLLLEPSPHVEQVLNQLLAHRHGPPPLLLEDVKRQSTTNLNRFGLIKAKSVAKISQEYPEEPRSPKALPINNVRVKSRPRTPLTVQVKSNFEWTSGNGELGEDDDAIEQSPSSPSMLEEAMSSKGLQAKFDEDSPLDGGDSILEEDEESEDANDESNCFQFLKNGFTDGQDELFRLSNKKTLADSLNDLEWHNRRLREIVGRDRFSYAQPQAIPADVLYDEYMRSSVKKTVFNRVEAKMVSNQLIMQNRLSKEYKEKGKTLEFSRMQSSLLRLNLRSASINDFNRQANQIEMSFRANNNSNNAPSNNNNNGGSSPGERQPPVLKTRASFSPKTSPAPRRSTIKRSSGAKKRSSWVISEEA